MKQELDPKLRDFEARLKKLVPQPFECELPVVAKKRPGRLIYYTSLIVGLAALLLIGLFLGIDRPENEEMPPVVINPPEIFEPLIHAPEIQPQSEPRAEFLNTREYLAALIKEMNLEFQPAPPEPVYGVIEIEQHPLSAEETASLKKFLFRRSQLETEPENTYFEPLM